MGPIVIGDLDCIQKNLELGSTPKISNDSTSMESMAMALIGSGLCRSLLGLAALALWDFH